MAQYLPDALSQVIAGENKHTQQLNGIFSSSVWYSVSYGLFRYTLGMVSHDPLRRAMEAKGQGQTEAVRENPFKTKLTEITFAATDSNAYDLLHTKSAL